MQIHRRLTAQCCHLVNIALACSSGVIWWLKSLSRRGWLALRTPCSNCYRTAETIFCQDHGVLSVRMTTQRYNQQEGCVPYASPVVSTTFLPDKLTKIALRKFVGEIISIICWYRKAETVQSRVEFTYLLAWRIYTQYSTIIMHNVHEIVTQTTGPQYMCYLQREYCCMEWWLGSSCLPITTTARY